MRKQGIIFIILLAAMTVFSGCATQDANNNNQAPVNYADLQQPSKEADDETATTTDSNTKADTATSSNIDTSDWQTYRNEELGFEVDYPTNWKVTPHANRVYIHSSGFRDGLSEGGKAVIIRVDDINKNEFINEYNELDEFSKIIKEDAININGQIYPRLTGTTAIGINSTFIFIDDLDNSYIIEYSSLDDTHKKIIRTINSID